MQKMEKDSKNEIIEYYEKIQNRAQTEIERVHSTYKIYAGIIGVIFTVGIAIAMLLIGKSLSDIETKYEQKYQNALDEAKYNIRKEVESELADAKQKINNEIKLEFEKDNIQNLVIHQTEMRIDQVADPIIESLIKEKLNPIKNDIVGFQKNIDKIKIDSYLLATENDSRAAFSKIYELSNDERFPEKIEVTKAIVKKVQDIESFLSRDSGIFMELEFTKVHSLSDFVKQYNDSIGSSEKILYLEALWKNKFYNPKQKISTFIKLFPDEQSFNCAYYMSKIFIEYFGYKLKPIDFEKILLRIKN